ncbi:mitochondrial dynamin GTPase Msp1 [Sporothrix bragantina]|uniref:Mitochondrial dynamin GTPase Msp1 n=1 Tax=Sporothrix bragantina TaxID=671064 RepID=A0ABP0AWA7_9PEZI
MSERKRFGDYAMEAAMYVGVTVTMYLLARNLLSSFATGLDPEKDKHDQARIKAKANLQRLLRSRRNNHGSDDDDDDFDYDGNGSSGRDGSRRYGAGVAGSGLRPEDLELNEYENMIALEIVAPEDIAVGFDDIGGLDTIIEELKESVIYPLTMPHLYRHAAPLLAAPSGVLLYGPPGCGKTMLAKALAHESGASFINLHISTLTEKWYGDSNKIVRAVFSLARKLQPAIIFIDEIDAVLGTRRSGEHEASGMVKAEFMTLWDGLTSSNAAGVPSRIVVLGATNRMHDIDEAILRRMPKKFDVPLPDVNQRRRILQLVLGDTKRDEENFDLELIARTTDGMSGSDLKELCRDAAMMPMREFLRQNRPSTTPGSKAISKSINKSMSRAKMGEMRGLRTTDFFPQTASMIAAQLASNKGQNDEVRGLMTAADEMESRRRVTRPTGSAASNNRSKSKSKSVSSSSGKNKAASTTGDDEYEDIEDDSEKPSVAA